MLFIQEWKPTGKRASGWSSTERLSCFDKQSWGTYYCNMRIIEISQYILSILYGVKKQSIMLIDR